jgi:hypothetical protein
VPLNGLAENLSGAGVERGVEGQGAMPVVLETMSLGSPRGERKDRIEPIQSLDSVFASTQKTAACWGGLR